MCWTACCRIYEVAIIGTAQVVNKGRAPSPEMFICGLRLLL
jgi:hypothetical protein